MKNANQHLVTRFVSFREAGPRILVAGYDRTGSKNSETVAFRDSTVDTILTADFTSKIVH
jgi:hypothetical protein